MKRLALALCLTLLLLVPSRAQDPVYLPLLLKGARWCMSKTQWALLEVSDGTDRSNLLRGNRPGFHLCDWNPALPPLKGGGTWQDSPLATGRRMVDRRFGNVVDSFDFDVNGKGQEETIDIIADLLQLLEKARDFTASGWQTTPVYLARRADCEASAQYALIYNYDFPQLDNPYAAPFYNAGELAMMDDVTLVLEHSIWLDKVPGSSACVQASGQHDGWNYQELWEVTDNGRNEPARIVQAAVSADLFIHENANIITSINDGDNWAVDLATANALGAGAFRASNNYIFTTATGANAGIWRTVNEGVAWTQESVLDSLAIVEADTGDLFAFGPSGEVIRSVDDGDNWAILVTVTGASFFDAIRADNGNLIAASILTDAVEGLIAVSEDDGLTWSVVLSGKGSMTTLVKQADTGYIFAGGDFNDIARIWYSTDDGLTWSPYATFPDYSRLARLEITSGDDDLWYAIFQDDGTTNIIKRSVDAGLTFAEVFTSAAFVANPDTRTRSDVFESSTGNIIVSSYDSDEIIKGTIGTALTIGRAATCDDEVYVANKQNIANLTHVKVFDATGPTYTEQFPAGAFPFDLFPAAPAAGDILYVGIESAIFDSGPFASLVFDLSSIFQATSLTLVIEYSIAGPGWSTLDATDNTGSFTTLGVNSVHWDQPSNWTAIAIDGVTAYWVRFRISAIAGATDVPAQQNRDIYSVTWARTDVDELQVIGDIAALLRIRIRNHSDEDGYATIDSPQGLDLLDNRVLCGLRSASRGSDFVAYLNCSDEQNPVGVTAADGANTTDVNDIDHPTGRSMEHTTTGSSAWTDECTFTLGPSIARDFYGAYSAFFRGQLESFSSDVEEVRVRLQARTGSGGVTKSTKWRNFPNTNDWQLLQFGRLNIPASGVLASTELGDQTEIVVQIWSSQAQLTVNLYDVILIPTNEWSIDASDQALEADSGVENDHVLDVDSVSMPKVDIRALVRDSADFITSIYLPVTPEVAVLQANADQRLWFLAARAAVYGSHTGANNQTTLTDSGASFITSKVETGQVIFNITDGSVGVVGATVTATTITNCALSGGVDNDWDTNDEYLIIAPSWRSEPWVAHSIQLFANARFLGMRGSR